MIIKYIYCLKLQIKWFYRIKYITIKIYMYSKFHVKIFRTFWFVFNRPISCRRVYPYLFECVPESIQFKEYDKTFTESRTHRPSAPLGLWFVMPEKQFKSHHMDHCHLSVCYVLLLTAHHTFWSTHCLDLQHFPILPPNTFTKRSSKNSAGVRSYSVCAKWLHIMMLLADTYFLALRCTALGIKCYTGKGKNLLTW